VQEVRAVAEVQPGRSEQPLLIVARCVFLEDNRSSVGGIGQSGAIGDDLNGGFREMSGGARYMNDGSGT